MELQLARGSRKFCTALARAMQIDGLSVESSYGAVYALVLRANTAREAHTARRLAAVLTTHQGTRVGVPSDYSGSHYMRGDATGTISSACQESPA